MQQSVVEKIGDEGLAGVAKPVIDFDRDTYGPSWHLRITEVAKDGAVSRRLTDLEAGGQTAPERPRSTARALQDVELHDAIGALLDAYRKQHCAVEHKEILHALNRLLVLTRWVDLSGTEGLGECIAFLRDTEKRVRANDEGLQRADVASDVLETLLSMTASFRDLSLSLRDIAFKLATKGHTRTPSEALRSSLAQLVMRGLQEVTPETSKEDLDHFLSAFIHASRCFFVVEASANHRGATADSTGGPARFAPLVDEVVQALRKKSLGAISPAIELFRHLHERVVTQEDTDAIAAYEVLLNNETFNVLLEQMATSGDSVYVNDALRSLLRGRIEVLWRAASRTLVRRPVGEFLRTIEALAKKSHESISADRIVYIFAQLNRKLETTRSSTAEGGPNGTAVAHKRYRDAQARYRGFLASLAGVNRLHLITMSDAPPAERLLATRNLNTIYNAAIDGSSRLERFFGNAAFQAGEQFGFTGSRAQRDVESMLQPTRSSPVIHRDRFGRNIGLIAQDYASGLPNLRGEVLRALGAGPGPGTFPNGRRRHTLAVEDWLEKTLIPNYDRLVRLSLTCYPLAWHAEEFDPHDWYDTKLVMGESGRFFVGRFSADGEAMLADLVDRGGDRQRPVDSEKYYSVPGASLDKLQRDVDALVHDEKVRSEVRALVHSSRAFVSLGFDRAKIEKLDAFLDKLRARLQMGSSSRPAPAAQALIAETFATRIHAMVKFFEGTSEFKKSVLEVEAWRRFFRDQVLTRQGKTFLENRFEANSGSSEAAHAAVVDRLFEIGCEVLSKFVDDSGDEKSITDRIKKIGPSFIREIDFKANTTEATVCSFNERHRETCDEEDDLEISHKTIEGLQHQLYSESEGALKSENIDYLMPNQALAAGLCRHEQLEDEHILLKMGTGQGKSIVIAMTALQEAQRLGRGQQGHYVFVLTSYDHLAKKDHALGTKFFKDVRSACLTSLDEITNLSPETKIIYANVKTLQDIIQKAIEHQIKSTINPTRYPADSRQLRFLQHVYQKSHRFILDEYDLVLNDLDYDEGKVQPYGSDLVDRTFVRRHRECAPTIATYENPEKEGDSRGRGRNKDDGEGFGTIRYPYTSSNRDEAFYHLRPGGLRVSRLLAKAQRVIGLSGSTSGASLHLVLGLEGMRAKYFELPSSRDPDSFGTRLAASKEGLGGMPGIWRTRPDKECADEEEYVSSIVEDVRSVRAPRDTLGGDGRREVRPVMIYVDPDNIPLKDKLRDALAEQLDARVQEKLTAQDIKGSSLQEIGFPGSITLVSALCGRGADIYVSPDVPDSMHVVIATSIPHERLKIQMIGRTGRMGRDGSYSCITLGKLIVGRSKQDNRRYENVLHDFSGDLVRCLVSVERPGKNLVRKWLMLASEVVWSRGEAKDAAVRRIEDYRHEFQ